MSILAAGQNCAVKLLLALASYRKALGTLLGLHNKVMDAGFRERHGQPQNFDADSHNSLVLATRNTAIKVWSDEILPQIEAVGKWLEQVRIDSTPVLKIKQDFSPYQLNILESSTGLGVLYPIFCKFIDDIMLLLDRGTLLHDNSASMSGPVQAKLRSPRYRFQFQTTQPFPGIEQPSIPMLIPAKFLSPHGTHADAPPIDRDKLFDSRCWEGFDIPDDSHDQFLIRWVDNKGKVRWLEFRQFKHEPGAIRGRSDATGWVDDYSSAYELTCGQAAKWVRYQEYSLPDDLRKPGSVELGQFSAVRPRKNKRSPKIVTRHKLTISEKGQSSTATLNGRRYSITGQQAAVLKKLLAAKGGRVPSGDLKTSNTPQERPDRVIKNLPHPIRKLIDSKPGRGGGFSLNL